MTGSRRPKLQSLVATAVDRHTARAPPTRPRRGDGVTVLYEYVKLITLIKMKILMRADTHYSIGVRTSEYEEPRYTYSQVPSI